MMGFRRHRRPSNPRPQGRRKARPALEGLEDRLLLFATNGGLWTYGSRITYSFVPDGTSIGGVASNLFATLNARYSTATWQLAIERAAAIWSSYANINLALVSDDGSPLGVSGNQQDDPRFGDIRIAMVPQSGGVLAFATLPPPINGGTNAGDIVFNSNMIWQINNDYDLETVALHEMGHALGLDHTPIGNAVMYAYYSGIKQSLTGDDTSGIQSLYGAYPTDQVNNGSFGTATNLTPLINGNGQVALGGQSLSGTSDVDYYVVTVPANTNGTMTVSMQSTNLSSVSPRVAVYNGSQKSIGQTTLPNEFGGTATFTVNGVSPGQIYYIRASAASSLGSYGAFGILVNFGSSLQAPIPPPNTIVLQQPDQGGGSSDLSTGTGGTGSSGGLLGGLLGVVTGVVDGLNVVHIGTYSAYADFLEAGAPRGQHHVHRVDVNGGSIPAAPGHGHHGPGPTNPTHHAVDAALSIRGHDAVSSTAAHPRPPRHWHHPR
jgi:hypothetical protein